MRRAEGGGQGEREGVEREVRSNEDLLGGGTSLFALCRRRYLPEQSRRVQYRAKGER